MTSDLISTNDAVTSCTRMYGFTDVQIPCRISGRKSMVISIDMIYPQAKERAWSAPRLCAHGMTVKKFRHYGKYYHICGKSTGRDH